MELLCLDYYRVVTVEQRGDVFKLSSPEILIDATLDTFEDILYVEIGGGLCARVGIHR